jgi:hypothetical protein
MDDYLGFCIDRWGYLFEGLYFLGDGCGFGFYKAHGDGEIGDGNGDGSNLISTYSFRWR